MKLSIPGAAWRKLALIAFVLVVAFVIVSDRRSAQRQLFDMRMLYTACARHSESLATQLEDFYVRIEHLEQEAKALKDELRQCKGHNETAANVRAPDSIAELQRQNGEYEREVKRLREELREARQ
ncbi:hypothetical protein AAVH_36019, partial [Aphelenchoides avenae]